MDDTFGRNIVPNDRTESGKPNVSIFGMGYVGAVTAACLAAESHRVIGVDPSTVKTDLIRQGLPPIIEKDLPELFRHAKDRGLLMATDDAREAILKTDLSLICVGTPSKGNGSLDDKYLLAVSRKIADVL